MEQKNIGNLNMDRSQRVAIETADLPWEESPAPGVWRKKLDREAAESGQVTSVVFEDEQGVYPQGTWLRNPPYSKHLSFTREGCTILVKTGHIVP